MLKLSNIRKQYTMGGTVVDALRGIDIEFRENEFVSILGPSGCGKTTTLNIIGGLDRYTSGDLIINGRSTREFKDSDWDSYRNHSIGFVFQSYNLIPHQTVLANVELALTLSGVSRAERRRRAIEALEEVGLGDQLHKKPNQMSGGQMQRVAIARALINNPDILLADEPTGALDSETSVQVMNLLKKVAQNRLVIMVTHNPELAETYSTRIIRLKDGLIVDDSNPYHGDSQKPVLTGKEARNQKRTSMSFATAFSLSLNNLMTKKGRTILTSFAGSIGIIGIALILALSTGINNYIDQVQQDTLSSYPITIQAETVDMSSMITSMMGVKHQETTDSASREDDRVYASTVMYDIMDAMIHMETSTNNLVDFKKYLDNGGGGITDLATVQYSYNLPFDVYTRDEEGTVVKSDLTSLMQEAFSTMTGGTNPMLANGSMSTMMTNMQVWEELLLGSDGELVSDQVKQQYDLLYGQWPENYNEVILFVDPNNEISDLMLVSLGLVPSSQLEDVLHVLTGDSDDEINAVSQSWSYEELCDLEYKLILPAEAYRYDAASGIYVDMSASESTLDLLYGSEETGTPLKVVGIARPNEDAAASMVTGAIGYTHALTEYAIARTEETAVVTDQLSNPDTDVLTGLPFPTGDEVEPTLEEKMAAVTEVLTNLSATEKANAYLDVMCQPDEAYVSSVTEQQMSGLTRESVEEMVVTQYAAEMGVDTETIMSYISAMSDEELFAQVRTAVEAQVQEQYADAVKQQLATVPVEQLANSLDMVLTGDIDVLAMTGMTPFTESQYNYLYEHYMPSTQSESTYEDNLDMLGYVDLDSPSQVSIYASTFSDKDTISDLISQYNDSVAEEDKLEYTDYVALLMSSITAIISGISYLLIAFVSISLIVSSIMIGVITLISVQERTKEIGILRSVGASKKDVSRVFNAETFIVGLGAGLVGIGITLILTVPINAILFHFTGLAGLKAALPWQGGIILIVISAILTIVAGLIPSRVAAKKDPVIALRTE